MYSREKVRGPLVDVPLVRSGVLTTGIGKYSMENAIALRAHAALDGLDQGKLL